MKMQWLGLDLFSYIYYIQYDETVILLKRVLVYLLYPMVISNMMQYIYMVYLILEHELFLQSPALWVEGRPTVYFCKGW